MLDVAKTYARVRIRPLPRGLHGLACKYPADGGSPLILVHGELPLNRRRFTLVHELAHIVLGWHCYALNTCHIELGQDLDRSTLDEIAAEEAEANEFASQILIPSTFLRQLWDNHPPAEALKKSYEARASSTAVSIRLLGHLDPGWSFVQVDNEGIVAYRGHVQGTHTRLPYPGSPFDVKAITRLADETVHVSGTRLDTWWLHHEARVPVDHLDNRSSTEILNAILVDIKAATSEAKTLRQQINGVFGAMHTKVRGSDFDAEQLHGWLRQRFEDRSGLEDVMSHPAWSAYLRRRAHELTETWVGRD